MTGSIVEVEQQIPEILHRLTPDECIDAAPKYERNQNPDCTLAEEFPGRTFQRKQQIT
jgi:hypothetical protein